MNAAAAFEPPSPTRFELAAVSAGLIGVPAIWAAHVLLCMSLVAIACPGGVAQRNAVPWSVVFWALVIVSVGALVLAIAAVFAAWRVARASLHGASHRVPHGVPPGVPHGVPHGVRHGMPPGAPTDSRNLPAPHREVFRFVAWCSVAVSVAFTIGLVFTIQVVVNLPLARLCETLR